VHWQGPPPAPTAKPTNGPAVAGLVCSVSGLVLLVIVAPFTLGFSMIATGPLSVVGAVLGRAGLRERHGREPPQKGLAVAGLVLGVVGTLLHVLAVIAGLALFALLLEALGDLEVPESDTPPQQEQPPVISGGMIAT
jgi:hypothetical protein